MRSAAIAALALVAAVQTGCDDGTPLVPADYDRRAVADRLIAELEAEGFTVDEGRFAFFRVEDCASLPSCYGNNPSSPYGLYLLPPAPDEVIDPTTPPLSDATVRSTFRLGGDEAVVFLGRTPPEARYFGFRSYLASRQGVDLFASLGDTTNHRVIATGGGSSGSFDQETVVVTTASAPLDARLRRFFAREGAGGIVNTDVLPSTELVLGRSASADVLTMLFRVALFADETAGASYIANPPAVVLRVRPNAPIAAGALPAPPPRPRGTGKDESDFADALARLEAAIRARHATHTAQPIGVLGLPLVGADCIAGGYGCLGDNADTLYFASGPTLLREAPADFLVIFGVDHTRAGKASYTNVAVYETERRMGVAALADDAFAGSAAEYLGTSDPDADHLFAIRVARDCTGLAHCLAVPTAFPGVPLDKTLTVAVRPYLEAATQTGPSLEELLPPRAIRFTPP
ncbi:MAG: hypothetical protein U0230_14005 [Polyangiales bacterium]